jgi:tetratricopeptide (TPR) repeat protein
MRLTVRTAAALLALATLLTYANSLGGVYVFDDLASLVNNPALRDWRQAFFPPRGALTVSGRPVLHASFAFSHALGGGAVWGHHVINVLIHLAAGLTLFGIVRRTLLRPSLAPRFGAHALPLAFFVALLWALHPLQTESVTYLVQRAESLMGLFFLLTFYAYLRGATATLPVAPAAGSSRPRRASPPSSNPDDTTLSPTAWFTLSVSACLLGVGTKEVIVVAPVLVLLHDRAFVAGSFRAAWRARRAFYVALFATWLPLAALVLGLGGNRGGTSGFDVGASVVSYWLTQFEAVTRYLGLTFWPHPLVFEYGTFWTKDPADVLPYAGLIVALAAAGLWALWRRPQAGFLAAAFFAILAPTSLMPGTIQMIVEHRMYLPLAAVVTFATLLVYLWLGRRAIWVGGLAAVAFAALTSARNLDYRTELSLWGDTVAKRPANASAHNALALAQLAAGETASALTHFESAIRLAPQRADYLANYAGALARTGRPADAIARYEEALRLKPDYADAHSNLGLILSEAGRLPEAIAHGETAVRLAPHLASTHGNFGVTLLHAQRPADAVAQLESALYLDATSAEAHNSLGVALIQLGRAAEALPHFEAALRSKPDYPQARDNLARLRTLLAARPAGTP